MLGAGETLNYRVIDPNQVDLRYQAPEVTAVSTPVPVTTQGGVWLTVLGNNFGFMATPAVQLLSQFRSPLACTNVHRFSHTNLTCLVPEGSGSLLTVQVTVADLSSSGGPTFNYTQPAIDAVTVIPAGAVTDDLLQMLRNGSYVNGTVASAASITSPMASMITRQGPTLTADPAGGDIIVVDGSSFGRLDPQNNCIFMPWAPAWGDAIVSDVGVTTGFSFTGGTPLCDQAESFLVSRHANASSTPLMRARHLPLHRACSMLLICRRVCVPST